MSECFGVKFLVCRLILERISGRSYGEGSEVCLRYGEQPGRGGVHAIIVIVITIIRVTIQSHGDGYVCLCLIWLVGAL